MAKYTKPDMRERWAEAGNIGVPTSEKIEEGWVEEIPPSEIANFIENRQDEALAYLMQQGIAEWEVGIEYQSSSFIQYEDKVYKSSGVNVGQQPDISPLSWTQAFDDFGAAADVQEALDNLLEEANPFEQYILAEDGTGTGTHNLEQLEVVSVNVDQGTPLAGNPKGFTFGDLKTTGFYQDGTTNKVAFQQAGAVTGLMPDVISIPSGTSDKTLATTEWVRSYISSALYPIGGLYTTTVDTNPSTLLGFGTWQRFGEGRALVGFSSDVTSATPDWVKSVSNTFGEFTHTLTVPQIPNHRHSKGDVFNKFSAIAGDVIAAGLATDGDGSGITSLTTSAEDNLVTTTQLQVADISAANKLAMTEVLVGEGLPHNNVQPSIVVFIWRRTV